MAQICQLSSTFILAFALEHKSDFTKQRPAAVSALTTRRRPSRDVSLLLREKRLRGLVGMQQS